MAALISSGSSAADNSVEPTRSTNITVSCRRSASVGRAAVKDLDWGTRSRLSRQGGLGQGGDRFQELAAVPDDGDANVFKVIGSQLGQNIGSDLILAERLLVASSPSSRSHAKIS